MFSWLPSGALRHSSSFAGSASWAKCTRWSASHRCGWCSLMRSKAACSWWSPPGSESLLNASALSRYSRSLMLSFLDRPIIPSAHVLRSEEHTSELQSRQYLVCRLLLEKKKDLPYYYSLLLSLSSTTNLITFYFLYSHRLPPSCSLTQNTFLILLLHLCQLNSQIDPDSI